MSEDRQLAKRPAQGSIGQATSVFANFFAMRTMPGSDLQ